MIFHRFHAHLTLDPMEDQTGDVNGPARRRVMQRTAFCQKLLSSMAGNFSGTGREGPRGL